MGLGEMLAAEVPLLGDMLGMGIWLLELFKITLGQLEKESKTVVSYLSLPEDTVKANCNFACNYKQTEHGKVNCYKQDKADS